MKKLVLMLGFILPAAIALAGRFQHPGIGLNREQLDQLKRNVQSGVEPWKSLYADLTKHDHRFSKKPRIFARRSEGITKIDSPDCFSRSASRSPRRANMSCAIAATGRAAWPS